MQLIEILERERLVAIVRGDDAAHARETAEALIEAGLRVVEIPLTTPDAYGIIAGLARAHGESVQIGGGTVLTADEVSRVQDAGATFIVTPAVTASIAAAHRLGIPSLAGAFTATEVLRALDDGASAVKLFPAHLGGPEYLSSLRAPLPAVKFIPVGGVGLADAPEYLKRGALALGLGSPLIGDAASGGSLEALRDRAHAFLTAVQPFAGRD
jgi:2-dehydro-3-deoxyphosphogluconate aldolase/(4S)-4-hydroxy-2-oxoglutarate aldolase